jgi:hypothetical protein
MLSGCARIPTSSISITTFRLPPHFHSRPELFNALHEYTKVGALMSYGPSYADHCRRAATYVDQARINVHASSKAPFRIASVSRSNGIVAKFRNLAVSPPRWAAKTRRLRLGSLL